MRDMAPEWKTHCQPVSLWAAERVGGREHDEDGVSALHGLSPDDNVTHKKATRVLDGWVVTHGLADDPGQLPGQPIIPGLFISRRYISDGRKKYFDRVPLGRREIRSATCSGGGTGSAQRLLPLRTPFPAYKTHPQQA